MGIVTLFATCFGLIGLQLPIAFALMAASLVWFATFTMLPVGIVVQRMAPGLDSFPLLAIPLFVLAGNLLNQGGIAARIFAFADAVVGHIRGGLAQVNIAAACSAASAVVGPIIPPSVIMVIYGVLAQVPIGDLFIAGIVPGLLIGALLMATVWVLVATGRVYAPPAKRMSLTRLRVTFAQAFLALLAPFLLTVGLLAGVATPTELGALTVAYAVALGFHYGDLTLLKLRKCLTETLVTSGVLVFIIAAAVPFGWIISVNNIPANLAAAILGVSTNPNHVLLIINAILLVVGCFMETTAILLIAVPTFLPLIQQVGIDPVHFGLVMILNLLIGATTPPFGVLLFIVQDIARVTFGQIVRAFLPFYVPLLVALAIVTYVPAVSLWLPAQF
jgi:tripartite ATP-independent transporter DctM subunit